MITPMRTDPLTPFLHWGKQAPYIHLNPPYPTFAVSPAVCKTGFVTSSGSGVAHRPAAMASVVEDGGVRFAAKWLCWTSAGTCRAIIVPADQVGQYGGTCKRCDDVLAGPRVYRCYDTTGRLLYIGSSKTWLRRKEWHEANASWWPEFAEVALTPYGTLLEARTAEAMAIRAEKPLRNQYPGLRSHGRRIA